MGVAERMKAAMKGSKSERAILIRDPNKLVSAAVLSSPKLTESEVENFAKLANVSEEVLRTIGMNRGWTKNYGVIAALTRNPKTPLAVSMRFVQRLSERDLKMIALDRNLQEPLKLLVRKRITEGSREEMIRMLSADDKLAEIKRLYYQTSRATIKQDFAKAIDLLKIDVDRRGAGASGGLHGRSLADAIGLGKAGGSRCRKRKTKSEKRIEIASDDVNR